MEEGTFESSSLSSSSPGDFAPLDPSRRLAHSLASEADLPGSGGTRYQTDSGKLLV